MGSAARARTVPRRNGASSGRRYRADSQTDRKTARRDKVFFVPERRKIPPS